MGEWGCWGHGNAKHHWIPNEASVAPRPVWEGSGSSSVAALDRFSACVEAGPPLRRRRRIIVGSHLAARVTDLPARTGLSPLCDIPGQVRKVPGR